MKKGLFICGMIFVFAALCRAQEPAAGAAASTYADEVLIVTAILDSNGIKGVSASSVSKEDSGRIVILDLGNKDIEQPGLTKLPPEIGKLTALRELYLQKNSIVQLPEAIGTLTNMKKLDLSYNQIAKLPASFSNLKNLDTLDLRNNQLTELPEGVYHFKKLVWLKLWGNRFTALPEAIANMSSLKELYVKDNMLTTLPLGLIRMKSLTYIDYQMNKICSPSAEVDAWLKAKDKRYKQTQKCW